MNIKRFRNWLFKKSEWQSANPKALEGEVLLEDEVDSEGKLKFTRMKLGRENVRYNDLSYFEFPYTDPNVPVTPVGDTNESLEGLPLSEVVRRMLNGYKAPEITDFQNNGSGVYSSTVLVEIGIQLSGTLKTRWNLAYEVNLDPGLANPLEIISDGGYFSNEGSIGNIRSFDLNWAAAYAPAIMKTLTITLKAHHKKGIASANSYLKHVPRVYWGVSSDPNIQSLSGLNYLLKSDLQGEYPFQSAGYAYLLVPVMFDINNYKFLDKSINLPYGISDTGNVILRANGAASYNLKVMRSGYLLNSGSILKVENA